ncbi:helix-turn-helix domain-containing protein [Streptomyces chiangmaiensis]
MGRAHRGTQGSHRRRHPAARRGDPTVADIAQAHGVSVATAHRAFAQLKKDGLIEASRGRRAVVRRCREEAADAA